MILISYADPF